jgi:hypothetical protein
MSTNTKAWYKSKTIWGILIAAGGFILTEYLKVPVDVSENADFEQLKAQVEAVKAANGNVSVILSQVISAFGSILAIIGRISAEDKIGK